MKKIIITVLIIIVMFAYNRKVDKVMIPDEAIRFRVIAKKDMQNRDRMIFISNKNIK